MFESRALIITVIVIVITVLFAFLGIGIFRAGPAPEIRIQAAQPAIGKRTPVRIEAAEPVRGLSRVKVEVVQGEKVDVLADRRYPFRSAWSFWGSRTQRDTISLDVGRDIVSGLKSGTAIIRVTADRTRTWLRSPDPVVQELNLPVRLSPPSLQLMSSQTYVNQGGCEVVVYRVGESSVRDGVLAGDWWFPGYPLPGGGKQDRFAFFAVPYSMTEPKVKLVAADAIGNEAERSFIDKFFPKKFKADSVEVSDAFVGRVVPEILGQTPELPDRGNLIDNYLQINSELRKRNAVVLKELAAKSHAEFMWSKAFVPIPNGKVMAGFADHRTYRYAGKEIDQQDHLGYDLAVTAQAPIPAANDGTVMLAQFFGIYGNAVVIDHGYGVASLYGHLSSIAVKVGQKVARGDIIGKTGATGLAGGDHLHFAIVLQGLPVNPTEWWDSHWIRDRLASKLGSAFKFEGS
jgi:murein DD-endopeptidase MepM/ murein hydrolase activator NlpD